MEVSKILDPIKDRQHYSNAAQEVRAINALLAPFNLEIDDIIEGASLIQYRATLTPDVNVNKLLKLQSNLKIALNCDNVQVEIKGNQYIIQKEGAKSTVSLLEFYNSQFVESGGLKLILGVDIEGNHIYTDLAKQPHMLVAGTTGSGKSMFLHQCIISLLLKNPGTEIYAVDNKKVEFNAYADISNFHYITHEQGAVRTLDDLVEIMESRYQKFSKCGYRDITEAKANGMDIEPIVCIIDEFADLMMIKEYAAQIEKDVVRLAQKSRAAGIHLIIATQRPTANVITGLIKANIPSRVCMHVNSGMESRIIMDQKGGEYLLGKGDLYFKGNGCFEPIRLQACFVSSNEMKNVGEAIKPARQSNDDFAIECLTTIKRLQEQDHAQQHKQSLFERVLNTIRR